jgi:hypothetical protein
MRGFNINIKLSLVSFKIKIIIKKNKMKRRDLKIKQFNDPSLNIIAVLKLSDKIILNDINKFKNVIATIYYKTNEELSVIYKDNLDIFYILFLLGFSDITINIFYKGYVDILNKKEDKRNILIENINLVNTLFESKESVHNYKIRFFDIIDIMNEELLDKNNKIGFFSSESNNIFIFENIS